MIHRSKAQFRSTGPTGLRGAPKEQDQGAGCLLESTAKALEVRSIHQEDSDSVTHFKHRALGITKKQAVKRRG